MIEYLVSFVQCLCLLGYLYGAWLVITHKAGRRGHTVPPLARSASHVSLAESDASE